MRKLYHVEAGKEYNKLTPIRVIQTHNGTIWLCRCRCGVGTKVHNSHVAKGIVKSCGRVGCKESILRQDLLKHKFGKLTVLRYVQHNPSDGGHGGWEVQCICGNKKVVRTEHLTKHITESCGETGCKIYKTGSGSRQLPDGVSARNRVRDSYKRHAQSRNLLWSLSDKVAFRLFVSRCHYCGVEPSNKYCANKTTGVFVYNGIDRKNNKKGYVKGNVVSCCRVCNRAKNSMSYKDFTTYLDRLASYHSELK